jgi:hypothetical protein
MNAILDFAPMTDYESINFMLLLPFAMEADDAAEYSRDEIDNVLQYAKQLNARADAAEKNVKRLRDGLNAIDDYIEGRDDGERSVVAKIAIAR